MATFAISRAIRNQSGIDSHDKCDVRGSAYSTYRSGSRGGIRRGWEILRAVRRSAPRSLHPERWKGARLLRHWFGITPFIATEIVGDYAFAQPNTEFFYQWRSKIPPDVSHNPESRSPRRASQKGHRRGRFLHTSIIVLIASVVGYVRFGRPSNSSGGSEIDIVKRFVIMRPLSNQTPNPPRRRLDSCSPSEKAPEKSGSDRAEI